MRTSTNEKRIKHSCITYITHIANVECALLNWHKLELCSNFIWLRFTQFMGILPSFIVLFLRDACRSKAYVFFVCVCYVFCFGCFCDHYLTDVSLMKCRFTNHIINTQFTNDPRRFSSTFKCNMFLIKIVVNAALCNINCIPDEKRLPKTYWYCLFSMYVSFGEGNKRSWFKVSNAIHEKPEKYFANKEWNDENLLIFHRFQ